MKKYGEVGWSTEDDSATISIIQFRKNTEETETINTGYNVVQNMERDSDEFCTLYLGSTNESKNDEQVNYLVLSQETIDLIARFVSKTYQVKKEAFENILDQYYQNNADDATNTDNNVEGYDNPPLHIDRLKEVLDDVKKYAEACEFYQDEK
jgi:hypothetical protein